MAGTIAAGSGFLIERVREERDVAIYPIGMFESTDLPWWQRKPRGQAEKLASLKRDLQKLAEITGTTARFPKDIEEGRHAAKEIVHEVGQHYGIGYYPGNRGRDGRWRRIKVEVFRRGRRDPGTVARTRTGLRREIDENSGERATGGRSPCQTGVLSTAKSAFPFAQTFNESAPRK